MSVNINDYKTFLFYCMNKDQSGNTMTIPQFNQTVFRAVMQLFEKDRNTFVETGAASDFLQNYLTVYTAQPNYLTGYLPYPSDWEHTSSVRSYYNGNEYPVEMIESTRWGDILVSQLEKPTLRFPKYSEFGNEYRFVPKRIGTVFVDYFRTPAQPIWNYTIVNDEPVYSASGSVNLDCQEFSVNQIVANQLALVGINLQDGFIEKFSQQYKQETGSIL